MKSYARLVAACLLSIPCFSQSLELPSFLTDSLDQYVARGLRAWKIPGAAVCVIKDGKVLVMKGYGVKDMDNNEKVDESTLFMIGSNTKAFTATMVAMLDARKTLSLDDPIQKWIPDFRMFDPWVAKEATVRDLLCHRLGFETFQGDFMFFDSDLTYQQMREKFSRIKPAYSFRSRWGYTNMAFAIAGEVVQKASGKAWQDFLSTEIFKPLQMDRTLALAGDIPHATNKATAHTIVQGQLTRTTYGKFDAIAPAGTISSSIADMSHWVMTLLDTGRFLAKRVIPADAILATQQPHAILGYGAPRPLKPFLNVYGLGWFIEEYEGRKIVAHTGGVNGFLTAVCLIPEERIGIIVFTNSDANNFYEALRRELQDAMLGLTYRDYSGVFLSAYRQRQADEEKTRAAWREKIRMRPLAEAPLSSYAGVYEHAIYGTMTVSAEQDHLVARFEHHNGRHAVVEPLGGDKFLATFNDPLFGTNEWVFDVKNGKVKSVTVRVADFVEFTPYEFVKIR